MIAKKFPREYATWKAMIKFADDKELSKSDWRAVGWLTMVDRNNWYFGPGNIRWASSETERANNEKFYSAIGKARFN